MFNRVGIVLLKMSTGSGRELEEINFNLVQFLQTIEIRLHGSQILKKKYMGKMK
jgi:hypothetical protein